MEKPSNEPYVIGLACTGCGECARACPENCIVGKRGFPFTINQQICTGCGHCAAVCPSECIAPD